MQNLQADRIASVSNGLFDTELYSSPSNSRAFVSHDIFTFYDRYNDTSQHIFQKPPALPFDINSLQPPVLSSVKFRSSVTYTFQEAGHYYNHIIERDALLTSDNCL